MPPCLQPFPGIMMNTGDDVFNEIEKTFGPDLTNSLPGDDSTASEPSVA